MKIQNQIQKIATDAFSRMNDFFSGKEQQITYIFVAVFAIIGFVFYVKYSNGSLREGFKNNQRCPNVLIQKDKDFFLFNTKLAKIPGVNPLQFSSLEDYKEFMDWQRSQGINCPVLYVQKSYDTQGNEVYQQRPDPTDLQGGLSMIRPEPDMSYSQHIIPLTDAGRSDPPYNQGHYPSFDAHNQDIGAITPLDAMDEDLNLDMGTNMNMSVNTNMGMNMQKESISNGDDGNVDVGIMKNPDDLQVSANPMDHNWGGPKYSQALVHQGYYKDNEVYRYPQSGN